MFNISAKDGQRSFGLILTEGDSQVKREFTTSADVFGNESQAINESFAATQDLMDLWWGLCGNLLIPVPDGINQEVYDFQDDRTLAPMRAARLERYILAYMRTRNFHDSAAAFSVEANVIEMEEDCDGFLPKFWIPLCNIRHQNVTSAPVIVEENDLIRTRLNVHILSYLRVRNFTSSAEVFGNESQAIQESVPATQNLLDLLWAGCGKLYITIPNNIIGHLEVDELQDDGMLPPMRAARLNRYILDHMRTNNFNGSAAAFSSEANVTESQEDCAGLLPRFWVPLYDFFPENIPPSVLDSPDFSFKEYRTVHKQDDRRMLSRFIACHVSSDGKFLAYGGTSSVVSLWDLDSDDHLATTQLLPRIINDVRFQPLSHFCAAACNDNIVRCWDVPDGVDKPPIEFVGRSGSITTIDFCPKDPNILCTGDLNGEVCFWDVKRCLAIHQFVEVGASITRVRFQPDNNLLAVALGKKIMVMFVQRQGDGIEVNRNTNLEGHDDDIKSICWDLSGNLLASVSRTRARVWKSAHNTWTSYYELNIDGYPLQSCIFHPSHPQLLIIGSYIIVHLWDFVRRTRSKVFPMQNPTLVNSLACSPLFVASASGEVTLWT